MDFINLPDDILLYIFRSTFLGKNESKKNIFNDENKYNLHFIKQNNILQIVLPSTNKKIRNLLRDLCKAEMDTKPFSTPLSIDQENIYNWQLRLPMNDTTLKITEKEFFSFTKDITRVILKETKLQFHMRDELTTTLSSLTHSVTVTFDIPSKVSVPCKKFYYLLKNDPSFFALLSI